MRLPRVPPPPGPQRADAPGPSTCSRSSLCEPGLRDMIRTSMRGRQVGDDGTREAMRRLKAYFKRGAAAAALTLLVGSPVACGSSGATDDGGAASGLPPGSGCGRFNDAGGSTIPSTDVRRCARNPRLPGCAVCVQLPDNTTGTPAICVYGCRVGMNDDCPAGQTCRSLLDPP